jgi:uncharacterized membrane protein YesL
MLGFRKNKIEKDIEKRREGKPRISIFFEILFRKFWKISKLNLLYSLCAIPLFVALFFITGILSSRITDIISSMIIAPKAELNDYAIFFDLRLRLILIFAFTAFFGLGPITAGFSYVLRNFAREEHSWLTSDFAHHSKTNFLQALIVFVIDIILFCMIIASFTIYASFSGPLSYLKFVVLFFGLLYMMMHLYIYPLMVTFDLSLKDIYKNSALFAFAQAPKNLVLLVAMVIMHFVIPYYILLSGMTYLVLPLYIIFELIALEGISCLMTSFFTYPSIEMLIEASTRNESNEE